MTRRWLVAALGLTLVAGCSLRDAFSGHQDVVASARVTQPPPSVTKFASHAQPVPSVKVACVGQLSRRHLLLFTLPAESVSWKRMKHCPLGHAVSDRRPARQAAPNRRVARDMGDLCGETSVRRGGFTIYALSINKAYFQLGRVHRQWQ